MIDALKIIRKYQREVARSGILAKLFKSAKNYADAQEYATGIGEVISGILGADIDFSAVDAEELETAFVTVMKYPHDDAVAVAKAVQQKINRRAGIGLNAVEAEYQTDAVKAMAQDIAEKKLDAAYVKGKIVNSVKLAVDDTAKANAEAQQNAGLYVRITRRYDHVGLHDGKDVCQWCLDRVGEWDNYQDALEAGAFERHPGCECYIEYHVGKTHTWANSKSGWTDF